MSISIFLLLLFNQSNLVWPSPLVLLLQLEFMFIKSINKQLLWRFNFVKSEHIFVLAPMVFYLTNSSDSNSCNSAYFTVSYQCKGIPVSFFTKFYVIIKPYMVHIPIKWTKILVFVSFDVPCKRRKWIDIIYHNYHIFMLNINISLVVENYMFKEGSFILVMSRYSLISYVTFMNITSWLNLLSVLFCFELNYLTFFPLFLS